MYKCAIFPIQQPANKLEGRIYGYSLYYLILWLSPWTFILNNLVPDMLQFHLSMYEEVQLSCLGRNLWTISHYQDSIRTIHTIYPKLWWPWRLVPKNTAGDVQRPDQVYWSARDIQSCGLCTWNSSSITGRDDSVAIVDNISSFKVLIWYGSELDIKKSS